jgi:glycosyltransferase involved in cell wall biosynthesis
MSVNDTWLVLGPLAKEDELPGGLTVSFQIFLDQLKQNDISFDVINTNKVNYKYKSLALLKIYWLFFKKARKKSHISMHGSNLDFIYLAPVIIFFSKYFSKTVSLRKFAGSFREEYKKSNFFKKKLVKYALSNSNINFFQTLYLIHYFKEFNNKTFWFPTVRYRHQINIREKQYKKRFIFLGHIYWEKGIDEILKVSNLLGCSYQIDLYGPMTDSKYNDLIWNEYKNIAYKGVLPPSNVLKTLNQYDVLVLPSYREGYPGVVIEAFSLGIPVIATKLEGVMEMIDDGSGILIDVGDVNGLKQAIESFNTINYKIFSKSALNNFFKFDAEIKIKEIIEQIKSSI